MIRCVAYSEVLGRMCGQPAYVFDQERRGWVCTEHETRGQRSAPNAFGVQVSPERFRGPGQRESLEELNLRLAIVSQANGIELKLAWTHARQVEERIYRTGRRAGDCGCQIASLGPSEAFPNNIFLPRASRCSPHLDGVKPSIDVLPARCSDFLATPESTPGSQAPNPASAVKDGVANSFFNPNAGMVQAFPKGP